ncbi:MAG TPA: sugar phosphate isomerase/epimerase family protein [Rhodocyclaceae bacterium]|nr:sugar phosphate isomerase/epimerase family protein [Rhodocyclaceae bacterium]
MKLSCLPVSFFNDITSGRMSVAEWARMGADLKLDAVDLSILFLPERTEPAAAALRTQVEAAGMRVTMLTTYPDFTHPDPAQRARELEQEVQAVRLAAALGAALIRVTDGQAHPETGRAEGIAWAVEGLSRLAETAGDLGVQLAYENHAKPGAWEYTDFSQPPEIFLEILSRVASPRLGVNFDTGNATAFAPDPVAFLGQIVGRVVSVHASDTAATGALNHVLLGTGVTPFEELFACLKSHGWDGWVCMEEASNQGRWGVETAAKFIRRTWAAA